MTLFHFDSFQDQLIFIWVMELVLIIVLIWDYHQQSKAHKRRGD